MNRQFYLAWSFFRRMGMSPASARDLVHAEEWVENNNVEVEWRDDELPWESDTNYEPEEVLYCVLTLGDETVSLSGIADPDDDYRRFVAAELALQLREEFFESLARHIRQL